jgi:hypothetical protein
MIDCRARQASRFRTRQHRQQVVSTNLPFEIRASWSTCRRTGCITRHRFSPLRRPVAHRRSNCRQQIPSSSHERIEGIMYIFSEPNLKWLFRMASGFSRGDRNPAKTGTNYDELRMGCQGSTCL